ncbi:MAG TPA: toll/interleukin-1 receptor domain-containing protein [Candidatus Dormibacteraeota bacterium]|nr:toll/interleukin-1 receptor domain-containing protein [Candidatus Dormibacteraeota bacterium]
MSTRIFVSYGREDLTLVRTIVAFLKSAGFDTWFDKENLLAGQTWQKVIEAEIENARLLLVCMSSHSVDKTGFVQKEMRLAVKQAELMPDSKVFIIPVRLDECSIPADLKKWHALDLREDKASFKLLEAIQNGTGDAARAPLSEHQALTEAVVAYNLLLQSSTPSKSILGESALDLLRVIEEEPDPQQRGIVEICEEIQPGYTHFFPRIQYAGSAGSWKARPFREALRELVTAAYLYPAEENPSTNTRTYEYRISK